MKSVECVFKLEGTFPLNDQGERISGTDCALTQDIAGRPDWLVEMLITAMQADPTMRIIIKTAAACCDHVQINSTDWGSPLPPRQKPEL